MEMLKEIVYFLKFRNNELLHELHYVRQKCPNKTDKEQFKPLFHSQTWKESREKFCLEEQQHGFKDLIIDVCCYL